jgi:REP element-mobilizing transposase RayT
VARQLRLDFPDALHHVTARALFGQMLFQDDLDRARLLLCLRRTVERYGWVVHAYCLMGTHYHLGVLTPRGNLSRGMRQLNALYAQRVNARQGRWGPVFQGRFKSILVERDEHLAEMCRYIDLNPVRAGICSHPAEYRWSSHRALIGLDPPPSFLDTDWLLGQFGRNRGRARAAYAAFVEAGMTGPAPDVIGGVFLGSTRFAADHGAADSVAEVPRRQWQPVRPTLATLLDEREGDAVLVACRDYGYRIAEVADALGVHYSTVSRRLRELERAEERLRGCKT